MQPCELKQQASQSTRPVPIRVSHQELEPEALQVGGNRGMLLAVLRSPRSTVIERGGERVSGVLI
jgi:hypothetical protein